MGPNQDTSIKAFAPYFWGVVVQMIFLGLYLAQSFLFYHRSTTHSPLHVFVAILTALGVLTCSLSGNTVYHTLIVNYGVLPSSSMWSTVTVLNNALIGIIIFAVQMLFIWRIMRVASNLRLKVFASVAIGVPAAVGFVLDMYLTQKLWTTRSSTLLAGPSFRLIGGLTSAFASSASIFASLVTSYLGMCKGDGNEMSRAKRLTKRFLFPFVGRGMLVSMVHVGFTVWFVFEAGSLIWTPLYLVLPVLYINTALVLLSSNTRTPPGRNNSPTSGIYVQTTTTYGTSTTDTSPVRTPDKDFSLTMSRMTTMSGVGRLQLGDKEKEKRSPLCESPVEGPPASPLTRVRFGPEVGRNRFSMDGSVPVDVERGVGVDHDDGSKEL